jgi:hypothetical protein
MQKKFKINDGANQFVEMNTLLEPANNSSSLQNERDEINEVSVQLSQIKKKHDDTKKAVTARQKDFEAVTKEMRNTEEQEKLAEAPMLSTKARLAQLDEQLQMTKDKIEEEKLYKRTYCHMLERMKKDFIASKVKAADLEKSLMTKKAVIDAEDAKQRTTKEGRLQSKSIFDGLMKNIEKE